MNISIDNEARQFAFVKGNRPTNAKTVKAKETSIKEHGQLSPITVAKGEDVLNSGGHLVDLDGNDIPDDQTENYYAVLDGQHRLRAYLNLGLNLDDLVICEPLNVEMSIAALIAEMNICTKTWTGTDYMAAPAMMLVNKNEVFEFAMYLRSKGCPLATISLWCTGANSLKPKDLVACVKSRELPKAFVEAGWYERSVNGMRPRKANFQIRSWPKVPDYPPLQEIQQCGRPYGVYCSDGGANQSTDCRTSARDYETPDRRGAVTGTSHI